MSWAWMAPLIVAGVGAWVCAMLAASVRRETARVRLARVELSVGQTAVAPSRGPDGTEYSGTGHSGTGQLIAGLGALPHELAGGRAVQRCRAPRSHQKNVPSP